MNPRRPLKSLTDGLTPSEPFDLTSANSGLGFHAQPRAVGGYVWPDVLVGESDPSPIVLVTAPGAMGKSAAALALAEVAGCPLVDLAQMQVGSNGLTGLLNKALGPVTAAEFMERLRRGQVALVLDGVDEAQLAAGRDNYLAFLDDIAWLLLGAEARGQVVMFGRSDSIESTFLGLNYLGFVPPLYEVAPLTHEQASTLIDSTLDSKVAAGAGHDVHRQHPVPFGQLRDQAFRQVAAALSEAELPDDYWAHAEDFLGYPPVVLAMAERLAVDNPQAELASGIFAGAQSTASRGQLLQRVVEDIMDRESDKVRAQLLPVMLMRADDERGSILYGREEQITRLVSAVSGVSIPCIPPVALTAEERKTYEEQIEAFVPDHPFLRMGRFANAVFSDYVRAYTLTSPLAGIDDTTSVGVTAQLPPIKPFFAPFVGALAAKSDDIPTCSEDAVSDLILSNAQAGPRASSVYLHRDGPPYLTLFPRGGDSDLTEAVSFKVEDAAGVLVLEAPLARCVVVTEYGVVLNPAADTLQLGPGVAIICHALQFSGQHVVALADAGDGASGCMLIAQEAQHDPGVRVSTYPASGALHISWNTPWNQWKPYTVDLSAVGREVSPAISSQVFLGIRRILMGFERSVGPTPTAYDDKFMRFAVGEDALFKAVLSALQDLGVVGKSGHLFTLSLDRLGEYGVNWAAVRGANFAETLRDLHSAVCASQHIAGLKRDPA